MPVKEGYTDRGDPPLVRATTPPPPPTIGARSPRFAANVCPDSLDFSDPLQTAVSTAFTRVRSCIDRLFLAIWTPLAQHSTAQVWCGEAVSPKTLRFYLQVVQRGGGDCSDEEDDDEDEHDDEEEKEGEEGEGQQQQQDQEEEDEEEGGRRRRRRRRRRRG